jgi:hypothetical protein
MLMTVYVDDMRAKFGRMIMCHMIADAEAELHEMAARIGVARRWYQGDHYDISLGKRALAVAAGAVEITWRQAGALAYLRRVAICETGNCSGLGDPATAVQRMLDHKATYPRPVRGAA